jgi:hypothetical protein
MTYPTAVPQEPTAQKKPDGTLAARVDNHTFVFEVFFNHNSKETFQDKLLRVILAEERNGALPPNQKGGLSYANK